MIQWLGITLLDVGHARAVLTAWTNAPGNPKPVPSYGLSFPALSWTQEDGVVLNAFAVWWNGAGHTPKVPVGQPVGGVLQAELTAEHLAALDKWAAGAVPLPPVVDVPASKALLVLWGKTDGAGLVPVDYGTQAGDLPLAPWSKRDGQALMAFGKWSQPPISGSTFTSEYAIALKVWFAGRAAKIPGGWVEPPVAPPAQKPLPTPPKPLPSPQPEPGGTKLPIAPVPAKSVTLYVLGGLLVLVVGGLWFMAARTPRAASPPGPQENPKQHYKIVVAWLVDDVEVVSSGRRDVGERPQLRDVKVPHAVMWKNRGTEQDIEKAKTYAASEGYQVFVYPTSERDPLNRARREISGRT